MPAKRRGRSCTDFVEATISRRDLYFHFIRILNPNSVQAAGRWVGSLDLSKIAPLVLTTKNLKFLKKIFLFVEKYVV